MDEDEWGDGQTDMRWMSLDKVRLGCGKKEEKVGGGGGGRG